MSNKMKNMKKFTVFLTLLANLFVTSESFGADPAGAANVIMDVYNSAKWVATNVTIKGEVLQDPHCMKPTSYKNLIVHLQLVQDPSNKNESTASIGVTGRSFEATRKLTNGNYTVSLFDQRRNVVLDKKTMEVSGSKLQIILTATCS